MPDISLSQVIQALRILEKQFQERGIGNPEFEEMVVTFKEIKLRRQGRTMRIPREERFALKEGGE